MSLIPFQKKIKTSLSNINSLIETYRFVILFAECLFGRAPFASRTLYELGQKIKDTKPVEVMNAKNSKDFIHWIKVECCK